MLYLIPDAALDGGGYNVDSRANAILAIIPIATQFIVTGGYDTPGDNGGATFNRVAGPLTDGASFQSADGAWWQIFGAPVNAKAFGAKGDGVTDDTAAIANLYAFNPSSVYYPDGNYLVSGNFPRLNIPHSGGGNWLIGGNLIPVANNIATAAVDYYVDPTGSDTLNHGLSAAYPFATPQRAYDSLPNICIDEFPQTINLAAGTYASNYRSVASMQRPAVLITDTKTVIGRTDYTSGTKDCRGPIVIKGPDVIPATAIIEANNAVNLPYGMYHTGASSILVFSVKFQRNVAGAASDCPFTSHRTAYSHLAQCVIDGTGCSNGTIVESNAFLESVDCQHTGATTYDIFLYGDCGCSLAAPNNNGTAAKLGGSGNFSLAANFTVTNTIVLSPGNVLTSSGSVISASMTIEGGDTYLANTSISGVMTFRGGACRLSACGFSNALVGFNLLLRLDNTNSFIAPAIQSTVAVPITLDSASSIVSDSTFNIVNSSGTSINLSWQRSLVSPNANGFLIPIPNQGKINVIQLNASGANRTACTLDNKIAGLKTTLPPMDGDILQIICGGVNTYSTEIVNGTTADIPGGTITIGGFAGNFSGCSFVYSGLNNKWILSTIGKAY